MKQIDKIDGQILVYRVAVLQLGNYVCLQTLGIITSTLKPDIFSVGGEENAFLRRRTAAPAAAGGPETEVH